MKKELLNEAVSRYRQEMVKSTEKLKELLIKAGYKDLLLAGVPCEIYRRCGKKTCKCVDKSQRHGPYKVVQVWDGKQSRQITLKKGEEHFYEKAKHYRYQIRNRTEVVRLQSQILKALDQMLNSRCIWKKK